jgi:8-oxo-dGTP diphosphatase
MTNFIQVAVGVIRAADGRVLLARRRQDVHQGGLWEFPGGKVEAGESIQAALHRELREELDIDVGRASPLIQVRHHYGDKSVLLDVWEVLDFEGTPTGNEGQPLEWVRVADLQTGADCPYPLPAANAAILKALRLPETLLITGDFTDQQDFVAKLARALRQGIRLVQLRPALSVDTASDHSRASLEAARQLCRQHGARLLVNSAWPDALDAGLGLHLTGQALASCLIRPVLAPGALLGASCHNAQELARAAELEVDYAVLSPVKATHSHIDAIPLGWERFRELTELVNFPVYALGGLGRHDLDRAKREGGQGVAAIGAFWDV